MEITPKDVSDTVSVFSGTGILSGLVAFVVSLGWWMRKERADGAKTNADVAASKADESVSNSQSTQINQLLERVGKQDAVIVQLITKVSALTVKVSELDSKLITASTYANNLLLCKSCEEMNDQILSGMKKTLTQSKSKSIEKPKETDE